MSSEPPFEYVRVTAGLIASQLDLQPEQVTLANQRFTMPTDDRLYVSLSVINSKQISSKVAYETDLLDNSLIEVRSVTAQETYLIVCYSLGGEARRRAWEIAAALSGTAAQQAMEKYSFKLAKVSSSVREMATADGASRINRYGLTYRALVAYRTTKPVDYFDQFAQPVVSSNP